MVPVSVSSNLERVRRKILEACKRYDRDPREVNLVAVSKTVDPALIKAAIAVGQRHFGENYLNEALEKMTGIDDSTVVWHYIGAIQSNKTGDIARHFSWVHTVPGLKVATRLSRQRPAHLPRLKVMVQVNISGETSKAGVERCDAGKLVESMLDLSRLEIRGLMAIPEPRDDFEGQRESFRQLRELKQEIESKYGDDLPQFTDLSMGMSADMEAAIAEGATWLRIGTAIFGPRKNQR
jgi:pyridoxal phosphate enzyme (YggS family)